jgi:hypothetical protein
MSVGDIRKVIEKYTGPNATDGQIPHADVEAMIRSAMDQGRITMGERLELLSALEMFGPNIIRPKGQLAHEDLKALSQTVMRGIETTNSFSVLSPSDQAKFLSATEYDQWAVPGLKITTQPASNAPDFLKRKADELFHHLVSYIGQQEIRTDLNSISTFMYQHEIIGYVYVCSITTIADLRSYNAKFYLNSRADVLKHQGQWEDPDPPDGQA